MLYLKPIFNTFITQKSRHTVKNDINRRFAQTSYFVSDDDIMENVLGRFVTIGINLPGAKNVLTETALEKLTDSVKNFECNDEIHVAVLHGSGGNFCGGMVMTDTTAVLGQKLLETILTLRKPIITALDGYTKDFGVHLAIMSDIRIMDKSALIGFQDSSQKLHLPNFVYERFLWTVGLGKTLELIYTRQSYKAGECLGMGLVNKMVDHGCALGQGIHLAQNIVFNNSLEDIIEKKSKVLSFLSRKV